MAGPVKTCAICASLIVGEPRWEPLGKDDAFVACCVGCVDKPARSVDGPDRGYELPDGAVTPLGFRRQVQAAYCAVVPARRRGRLSQATSARRLSPGHVLVRVATRDDSGASRDRVTAQRVAEQQVAQQAGGAVSLHFLGIERSMFLFEYPRPVDTRPKLSDLVLDVVRLAQRAQRAQRVARGARRAAQKGSR